MQKTSESGKLTRKKKDSRFCVPIYKNCSFARKLSIHTYNQINLKLCSVFRKSEIELIWIVDNSEKEKKGSCRIRFNTTQTNYKTQHTSFNFSSSHFAYFILYTEFQKKSTSTASLLHVQSSFLLVHLLLRRYKYFDIQTKCWYKFFGNKFRYVKLKIINAV